MNPLCDADIRNRALDPEKSFIVQAPAGSGKTELLTQRFLALLATVRRPDDVLAITFTRKAAAEMRQRLLSALERAQGPVPEKEHERRSWSLAAEVLKRDSECGWGLLGNPSLLGIQTIDSFNASLVRRMPWLSRFGGMPRIAENPFRLYREAVRRTLAKVGSGASGGAEGKRLLTHLDNRMDILEAMLVAMLQRRDQWLRHLVDSDHSAQRHLLEGALDDYISAALEQVRRVIPDSLAGEILASGRFAAGNLEGVRPLSVLGELRVFPGTASDQLVYWQGIADLLLTAAGDLRRRVDRNCGFPPAKSGPDASGKEAMQSLLAEPALVAAAPHLDKIRRLPLPSYPDDQWEVLQSLVALLMLAVGELWYVFREEGEVDFSEVAGQALRALCEDQAPSDLLLRLDTRLSHIMVDEFQDTSWLQFELLKRLTEGWQAGDGRTLFVVGDPMQSIYRFREAEVGLFLQARRHGIGNIRLEPLTLSANFRSQAGIVEWVNRSFERIFPETEDLASGAVRYATAVAVLPCDRVPAVSFHLQTGRDDADEAQRVATLVHESMGRGDASIAVLVRSRPHLALILPALREAGLRYLAQEIDPLAERPVARDLLSLTRALLHPGDRLAWLAILRAPWCGLRLDDLHALCRGDLHATVPALLTDSVVMDRLTPDGRERALRTYAVMQGGRQRRGRIGLRRLVEGCWLALGGPMCCDQTALEDAQSVLGLIEKMEKGGDLESFEQLEEEMARLFAAADPEADHRLQIMTIHKAKGLEFDTVIIPGLGRRPRLPEKQLLRWLEHPECGLLLAPIEPRGEGSGDPIYDMIGRLEKAREDHEIARLLYVGATRAKRSLHLLGHLGPGQETVGRPEPGSLLAKLWPAVPDDTSPVPPATESDPALVNRPKALFLRRLSAGFSLPALFAVPLREVDAPGRLFKFELGRIQTPASVGWEQEAERHVGTVMHHWLERIAMDGLDSWPFEAVGRLDRPLRRQLIALGVSGSALESGCEKIFRGLKTVLESRRGRWVLSPHAESACEYHMAGIVDGETLHAVIDRTFVDGDGKRWIIDYKTGVPGSGESHDSFYQRYRERYADQLTKYTVLFRHLEPHRQIRAALYFPMFDGWHEIPLPIFGGDGKI